MGEKRSGHLPFMKARITRNSPAISESRTPKPEQRLHPTLKHHHTKIKDFRSQRTGCKLLQFSSLGSLFHYTTTSGNIIPTLATARTITQKRQKCTRRWRPSHSPPDLRNPESSQPGSPQHWPEPNESAIAKARHPFSTRRMTSPAVCPSKPVSATKYLKPD